MSNRSIWLIDRTISDATTLGQRWTWEQCQWRGTPYFLALRWLQLCLQIVKFYVQETRCGWCDTMGSFRFCQSESPLSVLARNPHKGLVREISHETGRGWGKEGPRDSRQARAVKRRGSTDQSRHQTSRQKSREADGRERPLKMPGWPTRENEPAFLMALWESRSSTRSRESTEWTKLS